MSTLRNTRLTIPSVGRSIKDDWRATVVEDGPSAEEPWVGKSVFYETWDEASEPTEVSRVDRVADLPGGLLFTDIAEYSLTDYLSGEALDGQLVTLAKREEVTEIYRRTVWTEAPVADCIRDTGKPPIPVRWVSTNKGDKLHPNVRCRLVAKHLAAKYGGKEMEDLFAAMPPFELVKALLVKAVQRRERKKKMRKVLFIDVSKAHL